MAQLYSVAEASKNETGGGEGVEVENLKKQGSSNAFPQVTQYLCLVHLVLMSNIHPIIS